MDEDSAHYYMSNIYPKQHTSYLKHKRNLICGCEEVVMFRVRKTFKKSRLSLLYMSRQGL